MIMKKKIYTAPLVETCLLLSGNILWGGSGPMPEPGAPARRSGTKIATMYI